MTRRSQRLLRIKRNAARRASIDVMPGYFLSRRAYVRMRESQLRSPNLHAYMTRKAIEYVMRARGSPRCRSRRGRTSFGDSVARFRVTA